MTTTTSDVRTHWPQAVVLPLHELVLDPKNSKRHPERQLADLRSGLVRFGQHQPLVVRRDSRVVIIGNARLEAMRALGWAEGWCVLVDVDDATAAAMAV